MTNEHPAKHEDPAESSAVDTLYEQDQRIRARIERELEHRQHAGEDPESSGLLRFLMQERDRADAESYDWMRALTQEAAAALPQADKIKTAHLLVHSVSGPIDAPEEALKRMRALWPVIIGYWDLAVPFGGGHLGRNILNRLSGYARFRAGSPAYISYEGPLTEQHVDYLAGEIVPVIPAEPLMPASPDALLAAMEAEYLRRCAQD